MERRRTRALVVGIICVLGLIPSGTASSAPCRAAVVKLKSFKIEVEWQKTVYGPGDKAKLTVSVSRPGDRDPLDLGIDLDPPERVPAENVQVIASLAINYPYPPGASGVTDADGRVELVIPLPKSSKEKGFADATYHAVAYHNRGGAMCTEVTEETIIAEPRAIRIR